MNCCLQNMLHTNLHILYIIQVTLKNSRIKKIQQVLKKYQINKIYNFVQSCFQFVFHLNFKFKPGFQVNL